MNSDIISRLKNTLGNPNADEKSILYQVKKILLESDLHKEPPKEAKTLSELYGQSVKAFDNKELYYHVIKTGWKSLDNLIGGFGAGELVVIGGRPSMGKTQLLVNLAINISPTNPLLYFSYDLTDFILTSRFMACLSGVATYKILMHEFTVEEINKLRSLETEMKKLNITVSEGYRNSVSEFRDYCETQIKEKGIKVIMIDFLQMMGSSRHYNTRELELSHICRELKKIASDHNVCIIASSQLSRAVELRSGNKHPQLSDLRESGAIEQNADKVLFIHRPELYGLEVDDEGKSTRGVVELIVAKSRNGMLGDISLMTDSKFTSFKEPVPGKSNFTFSGSRLDEIDNPF